MACVLALWGCGREAIQTAAKAEEPAKVENQGAHESDLARITLTTEAVQRLGIQTVEVEFKDATQVRTYAAELTVPPTQNVTVASPVVGYLQFEPDIAPGEVVRIGQTLFRVVPYTLMQLDQRADAAAQKARAATAAAQQAASPATGTQAEARVREATSVSQQQTQYTGIIAGGMQYKLPAPQAGVIRQILLGPGQYVSVGAPVVQLSTLDPLWLRVSVYSGELQRIARKASARVTRFGSGSAARPLLAKPIAGPPTADTLASTLDLYYEVANPKLTLRPGERVNATLPLSATAKRLQVAWASILYDIHGGAWVYEVVSPTVFVRRRVDVDYVAGTSAILSSGPKPGTRVVSAGASELFGTEFGAVE